MTLTDLKANTRKSSSSVQSGNIFTLCRRAFVSVTCSRTASEHPLAVLMCHSAGSERSSEQCLDRLPVFKTNLSTTSDVFVPSLVRFYELAVSDITRPAAEKVFDRRYHPSPLCCVWLTGVSVAATLRFMGDWRCHQLARRVKSTVSPPLPLSTSRSPLSTDYCLKKKKESSSNQKQRCI